jgi:hypothetical protein
MPPCSLHNLSLHIWPRGSHFMMGLANRDGSFTMTLYMAEKASEVHSVVVICHEL